MKSYAGKLPNTGSRWLLIFTLLFAAVLLYLTLRGLDWVAFWDTIRTGHYEYFFVIASMGAINYFIRSLRWSIFLRADRKIPFRFIFWANMIGYMGNSYLPARAGEFIRSGYLGTATGLGASFVFATAMAERLLDLIALVLIGTICLLWQGHIPPSVFYAVQVMALAGGFGLLIFVIIPFQEKLILQIFHLLPLPARFSGQFSGQISSFLVGMRSLNNPRRLISFISLTAVIWLVDGISTAIGARIISQNLNLGQSLILLSALGLSSAIPSTPGFIGVYQFAAVTVLMPFGFSKAEALALILIIQVINYMLVSFFGILGIWQLRNFARNSAEDPQPK